MKNGVHETNKWTWWGIAITLAIVITAAGIIFIPAWQVDRDIAKQWITKAERPQQVDAYRRTIVQIVGGVVVGIGLYLTKRRIEATEDQLRVMEEGQVTDRFSKAIEQLASEKLTERLGGIYALERIAKDSKRDHWTVMETLCAFVRDESQDWRDRNTGHIGEDVENLRLSTDLQAACTVIGRRNVDNDPEGGRLDFTGAYLPRVNFYNASLAGSTFYQSTLNRANFREAGLERVTFWKADLTGIRVDTDELCRTGLGLGNAILSEDLKREIEDQCPKVLGPKLVSGLVQYDQTDVPVKEKSVKTSAKPSNSESGSTLE